MQQKNTHNTDIDQLITSFFSEELSPDQLIELENWIDSDEANKTHFLKMQEIWFSSGITNPMRSYNTDKAFERFLTKTKEVQKQKIQSKRRLLHPIWYAAAIALLLIVSWFSYQQGGRQLENQFSDMIVEAPLGSKTKLYLPDGSLVWLNAGSKIVYSQGFGVNERNINLSGEGYFEVIKNEKLPFKVKTDELHLQVLGTKFNFKNYDEDEEASISLIEGKVQVNNIIGDKNNTHLSPDQKAFLNKKTGKMHISSINAKYTTEWTNGNLFFDEESLPDIVKELHRSYNVNIKIMDESLNTIRFYGSFIRREQSIEEVLNLLSSTNKFRYTIHEDEIQLTSQ